MRFDDLVIINIHITQLYKSVIIIMAKPILPPIGTNATGTDANTYEFKGKQWRNTKNGRLATRAMARELIVAYRKGRKVPRAKNELVKSKGESLITNLDKLKRSTIERNARRSEDWLKNKLSGKDINRKHLKNTVRIGRMYLYVYDPKTKETLPVYDISPLVIPIKMYGSGFLGINLHYLPPQLRIMLLNKLDQFSKGSGEQKRLQLSYALLRAASKLKEVKPCIKRYLYSHTKTQFVFIPPDEWNSAAFLPVQQFRDMNGNVVSSQKVYRDSRKNRW